MAVCAWVVESADATAARHRYSPRRVVAPGGSGREVQRRSAFPKAVPPPPSSASSARGPSVALRARGGAARQAGITDRLPTAQLVPESGGSPRVSFVEVSGRTRALWSCGSDPRLPRVILKLAAITWRAQHAVLANEGSTEPRLVMTWMA